jgi:PQQ-dependent catabolism-associated CXXCW motif protein
VKILPWAISPMLLLLLLFPMSVAGEPGLFSQQGYRISHYRRPLPDDPPAGKRIDTQDLLNLIKSSDPLLVDVLAITLRPETAQFGLSWLPSSPRKHLPQSIWLPNVGYGQLEPCMKAWLERRLAHFSGGDLDRAIVFYCVTDCWMSWNAVKRASELGYRNLFWYPQGSDGWAEAGLPLVPGEPEPLPAMGEKVVGTLFECPGSDLHAALEKGRELEKQGLLLFFETDDCPFCQRMRAGVLADPLLISSYRQQFVAVALEMLSDQSITGLDGRLTSARELAHRLGVVRTPTLIFLDTHGDELYRHSGVIVDPHRFQALADYLRGDHQEKIGFREFFEANLNHYMNPQLHDGTFLDSVKPRSDKLGY